ncbi:GntR family transcriptional regulator [Rhodococcus koreensis]
MLANPKVLQKPGSSTERVISAILTQIGSGELSPGEQLRQGTLAERLGVSRVPVREALHGLAEQGVLVHEKHRGFFVAKRSPSELAQLVRLLELVGNEVLQTIELPDEATIARLRELNREMLVVVDDDDDIVRTVELNKEFHFTIFQLSSKAIFVSELNRLWRLAHPYIIAEMLTPEGRRRRICEHEEIIRQLAAHDLPRVLAAHENHRRRGSEGEISLNPVSVEPTSRSRTSLSSTVLFQAPGE